MFWFVFVPIVLFIIFLIIILVSSKSSNGNRSRDLKGELEAKNRPREENVAASKKTESKPEKQPLKREEPKVERRKVDRRVAAAAAVEAMPAVEEKLPPAAEEHLCIEESVSKQEPDILAEKPSLTVEKSFIEEEFAPSAEEVSLEVEEAISPTPSIEKEAVQEEVVSEEIEVTAEEEAYTYPPFDNARAMEEFGLSQEEADLFIVDLIEQIEGELPALQRAVEADESKLTEDISHMIKGSATNLGTGGAADVLIDFNTYMKTGDDPVVIAAHMRNLYHALADLKEQFQ
ncbi:MAG: hypothetical protein MUP09_08605 [Thiovulaceae bacterium]|nr:hypothetical protein [Sulfurimonadaceae bacterium]